MSDRSSNRAAECVGAVRWRGWRLPFIDYESWQLGRDFVFVLEREGDLMLVPLTLNSQTRATSQSFREDEAGVVLDALIELSGEGWHVVGRLHTAFVGYDAEDNFWRETLLRLGLWGKWDRPLP